jgi:DNA recombination protein RmuC
MPDSWTAVALIAAVAAVFLILWRIAVLHAATKELPSGIDAALAEKHRAMLADLHDGLSRQGDRLLSQSAESAERLQKTLAELNASFQARQDQLRAEVLEQIMLKLTEQARADRELLQSGLGQATAQLSASMESLTRSINERLEQISGRVSERLDEGFKKTNETFANVMARLATIDEAQKKIDGLTTNVVSLQELLGDKKARGAFGEVQLEALVRNILPPGSFEFQYTLSNGTRADCVLKLPEPTGLVAVDSKFPLENYHRMFAPETSEFERRAAQTDFRADLKKHIDAIASKYILPNETSDGAVMFVPAEAVFAEIHGYHPEVVAYAQTKRVWIVSPTTLMAVLNTARAVLKDVETRKQIHVIKDALGKLAKDFGRFDERMARLATHIRQAHEDAQEVQTSGRKISAHFTRIEHAQLDEIEAPIPLERASD